MQLKKQEEIIEKGNKDRISIKKELIESNYEKKQFELQLKNSRDELQGLRSELKAKAALILAIEKEKRKLETDLNRSQKDLASDLSSRSRDPPTGTRSRNRSVSADRLTEQRTRLGKQLLQTGQAAAYTLSKGNVAAATVAADSEKLVLLQKLLLHKSRLLAERDVTIEHLSQRLEDLEMQVSRLKKTRYLAEELTECRHQLSLRTNQLEVCCLACIAVDLIPG